LKVYVSPEAAEELTEAAAWYELESPGLGEQLIDTFEQATATLGAPNPPLVPATGEASRLGAKRLILQQFPFSLVTVTNGQSITIIAIAHHSRKPGYWHDRISP